MIYILLTHIRSSPKTQLATAALSSPYRGIARARPDRGRASNAGTVANTRRVDANAYSSRDLAHLGVLVDKHEGVGHVVVTKVDHAASHPALHSALRVVQDLLQN